MNPVSRLLGHLLDCRHATRLISQLQERPLGSLAQLRLRLHLAACDACSAFSRQLVFMREAMRRYRN